MYKIDKLEKKWSMLLSRIKWDLFLTFTYKINPKTFDEGYHFINEFFTTLKKYYPKTQFSGISFGLIDKYNLNRTTHFHSLLTSNPNYPFQLKNITKKEIIILKDMWLYGRMDIQVIYSQKGINNYISNNNIRIDNPDEYQIFLYRKPLIIKQMKEKQNGI